MIYVLRRWYAFDCKAFLSSLILNTRQCTSARPSRDYAVMRKIYIIKFAQTVEKVNGQMLNFYIFLSDQGITTY